MKEGSTIESDKLLIKSLWTAPEKIVIVKNVEGKLIETVHDRKDIEKESHVTLVEGIIIPPEIKSRIKEWETTHEYHLKRIEELNHFLSVPENQNAFGLFDMGKFGFGTIARRAFKLEEVGTYYAGKLYLKDSPPSSNKYTFNVTIATEPSYLERRRLNIKFNIKNASLDASEFGNISRFMQHAPTQSELDAADLPGINKEEIAVCNFDTWAVLINNVSTWLFKANKPIEKNELAFTTYSPAYWKDETFWLFNKKTGEPVVEVRYDENNKIVLAKKELTSKIELTDTRPSPRVCVQNKTGQRVDVEPQLVQQQAERPIDPDVTKLIPIDDVAKLLEQTRLALETERKQQQKRKKVTDRKVEIYNAITLAITSIQNSISTFKDAINSIEETQIPTAHNLLSVLEKAFIQYKKEAGEGSSFQEQNYAKATTDFKISCQIAIKNINDKGLDQVPRFGDAVNNFLNSIVNVLNHLISSLHKLCKWDSSYTLFERKDYTSPELRETLKAVSKISDYIYIPENIEGDILEEGLEDESNVATL